MRLPKRKYFQKMQNELSNFKRRISYPFLYLGGMVFLTMSGYFAEAGKPIIMAHRGASADCPENTLSAIMEAAKQKATVVEFDVRQTSDGTLILFHDKTFERFTGKKDNVEDQTWEAIKDTDVGSWFTGGKFKGEKMPLFENALKLCFELGITPLIEHKTGTAAAYAKVIADLDCGDKVIVQSFSWSFLKAFQKEMPDVKLGALGSKELTAKRYAEIKEFSPDWVGWAFSDLTAANLTALQKDGFLVTLWTINKTEDAQKWMDLGVDGIITDRPGVMLDLVGGN